MQLLVQPSELQRTWKKPITMVALGCNDQGCMWELLSLDNVLCMSFVTYLGYSGVTPCIDGIGSTYLL